MVALYASHMRLWIGGLYFKRHREWHVLRTTRTEVEAFLFGLLSMLFIDTEPSRSPCDASVGLTHTNNDTRHDKKCPSISSPAQPSSGELGAGWKLMFDLLYH